jgi:hypothetical protein
MALSIILFGFSEKQTEIKYSEFFINLAMCHKFLKRFYHQFRDNIPVRCYAA